MIGFEPTTTSLPRGALPLSYTLVSCLFARRHKAYLGFAV